MSGPTLPYLKHRVDSNYEQISRALVARSVGFLSGAVAGGVLCDRFYRFVMPLLVSEKEAICDAKMRSRSVFYPQMFTRFLTGGEV